MISTVILVGLSILALILIVDGIIGWSKSKTVQDLFILDGGLKMGSFIGTVTSANFSLGNMIFLSLIWGAFYGFGGILWLIIGFVLAAVVYTIFMKGEWLPKYIEDRMNSGSVSDFLGERYKNNSTDKWALRLRFLAAVTVILTLILALALELYLASSLLSPILGLEITTIFILLLTIIGIYSAVGGYWSVISTDIIQGSLLIIAFIVLGLVISGLSLPLDSYTSLYEGGFFDILMSPGWTGILSILAVTFGWFLVSMDTWQRASATRSAKTSVNGLWVGIGILIIGIIFLGLLGVYDMLALSSVTGIEHSGGLNPITDLYQLADTLSFGGIIGLGFAALAFVMAGLSTVDTFLIAAGHSFVSDILIGVRKKKQLGELNEIESRKFAKIGRIVVLLMAALVVGAYFLLNSLNLFSNPLATFFIIYSLQFTFLVPVLGALRKKSTPSSVSAFWSVIIGLIGGICWGFGLTIASSFGVSSILGITVSELIYLTPIPIIILSGLVMLFSSKINTKKA